MDGLLPKKKLIIVMEGLPARGKTYTARKIANYLNWTTFNTQVFNIGHYRRQMIGTVECHADFFSHENPEGVKRREGIMLAALDDLVNFLANGGGQVAILDGTNTTLARRTKIRETLKETMPKDVTYRLVWIECICNDEELIKANIKETKISSPDYEGVDSATAIEDFTNRISNYAKVWEPIQDSEGVSYIKIIDAGKQFVIHNMAGFLPGKVVSFVMNLSIRRSNIYLTRHGESQYNTENRIGGDSNLSERGEKYTHVCAKFLNLQHDIRTDPSAVRVITSTMKRARQTAETICHRLGIQPFCFKQLDEINVGICDGMTYEEVASTYPENYKERQFDKLRYRYPRGESYLDLIQRVEPLIFDIERSPQTTIVVAHQAIIRCLYAYFTRHDINEVPFLDIPLHSVIELYPGAYGLTETRYELNVDCAPEAGLEYKTKTAEMIEHQPKVNGSKEVIEGS